MYNAMLISTAQQSDAAIHHIHSFFTFFSIMVYHSRTLLPTHSIHNSLHLLTPKFQSIPLPSPSNHIPTSPLPSHSFPLRLPGFQTAEPHGKLDHVSSFRTIPIQFPLPESTDRGQSQEVTLMSFEQNEAPQGGGGEEGACDQTASSAKSNGSDGYSWGPCVCNAGLLGRDTRC